MRQTTSNKHRVIKMEKKKLDYSTMKEATVVLNEIKRRYKKGLMTLILTTGLPGTGKSSTDIRLAELIAKELGKPLITSRNIVDSLFGLIEFVERVKEKGEILIVEEVSVLFPSVRAMTQENVIVGKVLDTLRKKQIILFANAPLLKRIDKHILSLSNILVETMRINKTKKVVISTVLRLQTNPRSGKTYFHRFTRNGRDINKIFTRKPNGQLWDDYEAKKDVFIKQLYERLKIQHEKKEKTYNKDLLRSRGLSSVQKMTPRELQVYNLVLMKGWTQTDVAKQLGLSIPRISLILKNVCKKQGITKENEHITTKDIIPPLIT